MTVEEELLCFISPYGVLVYDTGYCGPAELLAQANDGTLLMDDCLLIVFDEGFDSIALV